MSGDSGAQGRGGAQPPDPMTEITNTVESNHSGLMFVTIVFEVAKAHRFVFQEIMYGPIISYGYMGSVSNNS